MINRRNLIKLKGQSVLAVARKGTQDQTVNLYGNFKCYWVAYEPTFGRRSYVTWVHPILVEICLTKITMTSS